MCGRASISKKEAELEKRFKAKFYSQDLERFNPLPNYNIRPRNYMPVITDEEPDRIQMFNWGLVPHWVKDLEEFKKKRPMLNSRIETVKDKPSFRTAIRERRCLVLMDGFYEFVEVSKNVSVPYHFQLKDRSLFAVAGIWEKWGSDLYTFSFLTQDPNGKIAKIHDRMPGILLPEQEGKWLDKSRSVDAELTMIQPYPEDLIEFHPVDRKLNGSHANDPCLIEPFVNSVAVQSTLF